MTTSTATKKTFDVLELKDNIQTQIFNEIKHLSEEEQIQYYRKESEQGTLGKWWREIKQKTTYTVNEP